MEFENQIWTIKKLAELYHNDKLNLSPPYQRNEVWTKSAQRLLIDSITNHLPIPCFFVYRKDDGNFEIVDGQQRCRSILLFLKGGNKPFTNTNKETIADHPEFNEYPLNITLITNVSDAENIENFYALVNRTGSRLNKPELFKAQYYDTSFLALITAIADDDEFKKLGLFRSVNRMNDSDLISELLALLKYDISDKKEKVEQMFEEDISEEERIDLKQSFFNILSVLNNWSRIKPFNKTRFKQKNDMYTLFSLIRDFLGREEVLDNMYKWLIYVEEEISPSQSKCEPFKEYAIHCVTQSNSKKAREQRLRLMKEIIFPRLNPDSTDAIKHLYGFDDDDLKIVDGETMYDAETIRATYHD